MKISDEDAYTTTRRLAREEGILVGPSSGAACFAAIETAKRLPSEQIVICMTADTGNVIYQRIYGHLNDKRDAAFGVPLLSLGKLINGFGV